MFHRVLSLFSALVVVGWLIVSFPLFCFFWHSLHTLCLPTGSFLVLSMYLFLPGKKPIYNKPLLFEK